jgi:carboxypeptidase C (cathepsin A)
MHVIIGVQEWLCNVFIEYGLLNKFTAMMCRNVIKLSLAEMSPYDYTTKCSAKDTCYDFTKISRFLEKPEVKERLKIEGKKWRYTDQDVSNALLYDNFKDYGDGFTELLDKNISVTFYYGDLDFTCNYKGGLAWLKQLKWKYTDKLLSQPNATLKYDDKIIGIFKAYHLFNFIVINNATHFVTMNRPELGPLLVDLLAGRGVYKFKYSSGVIEVPIGSPSKTYRLLLSNTHKVLLLLRDRTCG